MSKFFGAFVGLGVVMIIGFLLVILGNGHGLVQLIGMVLMFGAVFAAPPIDMKLREKE